MTHFYSFPSRTNPIKSVRNVLRFGRSRSSSVEEDERALVNVSNPTIATSSNNINESSDYNADAIRRLSNGHDEDVESGLYRDQLKHFIGCVTPSPHVQA